MPDRKLQKALDGLASLYEYGELLLASNPAEFMSRVVDEIKQLRQDRKTYMDELFKLQNKYIKSLGEIKHLQECLIEAEKGE